MALIDIIKYDAPDDTSFVWKYPSEDLKIGSQVIVNQGQEVIFVKGGQTLDLLEPGTHTLSTGNIPLLNKLINLPFNFLPCEAIIFIIKFAQTGVLTIPPGFMPD